MIRGWMKRAREWTEDRLRRMCGAMNPDTRVFVTVALFLLFAALSLWGTVSAIYRLGRSEGERLRIEHIERPELKHERPEADSLRKLNMNEYEQESAE